MIPVSVRLFVQQLTCNIMFYSFWKAFVKCPSLSVNGISDDVISDVISSPRNDVVVFGEIFYCFRMICVKNSETVSKFVKVMPLFPDTVYIHERDRKAVSAKFMSRFSAPPLNPSCRGDFPTSDSWRSSGVPSKTISWLRAYVTN